MLAEDTHTDTGVSPKKEVPLYALSGDVAHPDLRHCEPGDGPTKVKVTDDCAGRETPPRSTNLDPLHLVIPRPLA